MGALEITGIIVATVTVLAFGWKILGSLRNKIFEAGYNANRVDQVEERCKLIDNDLVEIKRYVEKIPTIVDKVTTLWSRVFTVARSPVVLNDIGNQILETSGIKPIIEERLDNIIEQVKNLNPETALQAQNIIIAIIGQFKDDENLSDRLEEGAFISGYDVDAVLLVGAIHFRDQIFKRLDVDLNDLGDTLGG